MLRQFSKTLQTIAKGWVVLLFLLLFILTLAVVFPLFARLLHIPRGLESIDTLFYYTPGRLYGILQSYGEQGRLGSAISHITADLIYPLVYAIFFATSISYTFLRALPRESRLQLLNLLPFGLALIDLLENLTLIVLLLAFPNPLLPLAWAAGVITAIKWVAVGCTIAITLTGVGLWLARRVREIGGKRLNKNRKQG